MENDRQTEWAAMMRRINESPIYGHLGMRVEEMGDGYARLRMRVGEHLHQLYGVVHGGIAASLADSCIGVALISLLPPEQLSTTAELKVNYLAPVTAGELTGEGRIVHRGTTLAVGEADVRDQSGRLVAKALSTYMILGQNAK